MATISKARRPLMPAISPSSILMQSHSTLSQVCATHWKRTATTVKFPASLMGPTAGMFDSIFFNCLRVIGAGIAIGLCSQGNILGTFIFILLYGISQSLLKWFLLKLGYTLGTSFIDTVFNSGLMSVATRCASILGLMMVGAMTATTVGFPLNWTLNIGETSIVVSELFNAIYPGILSLALVLFMMWRIKKGNRPTQLIIGLLIFGLLGAFLGIF